MAAMEQAFGRFRRSADERDRRVPGPVPSRSQRDAAERSTAARRIPVVDLDVDGWRSRAACRHVDPNLFFPNGNTGAALGQIEAAKAFCRSCPVQHDCLEFALESNQEDGVWGGKDETERRRLRRDWRQARQLRKRPVGV